MSGQWQYVFFEHDLARCPRCGVPHLALPFRRLTRRADTLSIEYPYWATCPETGEPVLLEAGQAPKTESIAGVLGPAEKESTNDE